MTRTKTTKTRTTKPPRALSLDSIPPEGMARLRGILPRCQRMGATIGASSAITAMLHYESLAHAEPSGPGTAAWSRALGAVEKAHGDSPALHRLDEAHGAALCDVSDEAFLAGYFAGLAAVGGGR